MMRYIIRNTSRKNQFIFKNSSILTGMEFHVKACLNTEEKLSWFDKSVYISGKCTERTGSAPTNANGYWK